MTLVLFDIDGTLLRCGGTGASAMAQAAGELYGRFDMFDGMSFAGAVDSSIVRKAMMLSGLPVTGRRVGRLHRRYVRRLIRSLRSDVGDRCPGVFEILEDLKPISEVGLLTGNWRESAVVKLRAFDLAANFEGCVGAYGGDAMSRNDLVPIAYERARRRHRDVRRIVVIGDTPADVQCAQAGHLSLSSKGVEVCSVAVETGFASPQQLRAASPDLQIHDFVSGKEALINLVNGGVGGVVDQ